MTMPTLGSLSGNLFDIGQTNGPTHGQTRGPTHVPARGEDEQVDVLAEQDSITLERIVSTGQASPPGFWYDSPRDEWVVLLKGAAALEFEGDAQLHPMRPGDYVRIAAHRRHRVAWTDAHEPTVWLAVHYGGRADPGDIDKAVYDRG